MTLLYEFEQETVGEIMAVLARNMRQRRLEKGLSRNALALLSNVPAPTIAKFEQKHTLSLSSFVALAQALGYSEAVKSLLSSPVFSTMEELDTINRNKNRKRGRNEMDR